MGHNHDSGIVLPDTYRGIDYFQILSEEPEKVSSEIVRKLCEKREFLLDHGLLRKNLGDIRNISDELRKEIWEKFIDASDPLVKSFEKDLKPVFSKQEKSVLANIARKPPPKSALKKLTQEQERFIDAWLFDQSKWVKEFSKTGKPHIEGGTFAGGVNALDALNLDQPFDVTDPAVLAFVKKKSFAFSFEINKTTAAQLRTTLGAALGNGESIKQITDRVQTVFGFADSYRARMIAQTETIGSVNFGAMEGNKQSGVVWGTQWLGSLDEHIRESHEEMTLDDESAKLGTTFSNGLEYPGDSSGDAEEVINCRCTTKPLTEKP